MLSNTEELVRMCMDEGIKVTAVPGAAACITALTMSGLSTRRFAFEAFLPADKKERSAVLKELSEETRIMLMITGHGRLDLKIVQKLHAVAGIFRRDQICLFICKDVHVQDRAEADADGASTLG